MRTVNLTLDDSLWKEARVEAARRDMSVSALMREALGGLLRGAQSRKMEEKQRGRLVDLLEECQIDLTERPTREATYAGSRFH
jgi:plasmid stability protein